MTVHPIEPFYDENSKILVLGSFPSVKSRQEGFFYAHRQNRFWKVMSFIFEDELPETVEEKKAFLRKNKIALWDVIHSCDIEGSSDSSIKNVTPNDISRIIQNSKVKIVFVNGKKAEKYYKKYIEKNINIKAICLPSTSPANAAWRLENLVEAWAVVRDDQN